MIQINVFPWCQSSPYNLASPFLFFWVKHFDQYEILAVSSLSFLSMKNSLHLRWLHFSLLYSIKLHLLCYISYVRAIYIAIYMSLPILCNFPWSNLSINFFEANFGNFTEYKPLVTQLIRGSGYDIWAGIPI